MLNLDTHVLLHAVGGRLSARETRLLESNQWSISAIVLWEIAKLGQLGRIELDLDDPEVVRTLARVTCGRSPGRSRAPARGSTFAVIQRTRSSARPASCTTCLS
jgi:hypothetical protein